jgi:hypothetical protein
MKGALVDPGGDLDVLLKEVKNDKISKNDNYFYTSKSNRKYYVNKRNQNIIDGGQLTFNIPDNMYQINKKSKERLYFYSDIEFNKWCLKNDMKLYEIDYKKGIASLESVEIKILVSQPKLIQLQTVKIEP